jgi:DNA (cytosine-5)-methyltransferase 1
VGGIEALGYECHMKVLNALEYGVPQRRQRVIFIGLPPSTNWAWPRPSHGPEGDFPARTVSDALSDLPDISASESADSYTGSPQNEYQRFLRGGQSVLLNHIAPKHPPATIERIANTEQGEPMYPRFKQRIRLHPERPSPTVVSGGIRPQFAHGHPWRPRGLTIRERARLQSFPDWYSFEGGVTQGRVQTGDAVPPIMAWRLAQQIRGALTSNLKPERSLTVDSGLKQLVIV